MKKILILFCLFLVATVSHARKKVPVILVAGQSNADGRVPLAELPDECKSYRYCQWSYGSGDFEQADGTFSLFSPRVAKPKIEASWGFDAVVYKKLEELWQRPFYVIKQTMGGTAIDTSCKQSTNGFFWSYDAEKSLLKAFEQQIDNCLPNLPKNYDIKCLIWHQGESDQKAADRYYDNLKAVIAHLRQHLVEVTGEQRYASLPVICGTFAKGSRQGSKKVAEALYRLQSEDVNFHVVDASDLSLQSDQLHFDAKGAITLGERVFEKLTRRPLCVWPVTDKSLIKSLNGEWQLKVVDKIDDHLTPVPAADASWGTIPVPGCWESYGFCEPRYNYPDSLTGYYRTSFTVPLHEAHVRILCRQSVPMAERPSRFSR